MRPTTLSPYDLKLIQWAIITNLKTSWEILATICSSESGDLSITAYNSLFPEREVLIMSRIYLHGKLTYAPIYSALNIH